MTESIDNQIAKLETELSRLRTLKATDLRAQLAQLESQIQGKSTAPATSTAPAAAEAPVKRGRGRAKKASWVDAPAAPAAKATRAPKTNRRGRRPGPRTNDTEALETLLSAVRSTGSEGTSARAISDVSGIFYPRVNGLLKKHKDKFKRTGSGKWTRYTIK